MPLRDPRKAATPNRVNYLRQTITAFVDLLGLGEELLRLDEIAEQSLGTEASKHLVHRSLGAIRAFRRTFDEHFRSLSEVAPPEGLTTEQQQLWGASVTGETRVYWFSDCALINTLIAPPNALGCVRDAISMLMGLSLSTLRLAVDGQLLRGGIDMGWTLDNGEEEVLGSGLVRAYRLESHLAHYPRILIGGRFLGFLDACESDGKLDSIQCPLHHRPAIRAGAQLIRRLIITDGDGLPRVHFMSPLIVLADSQHSLMPLAEMGRQGIARKIEQCDPQQHPDRFVKYHWMQTALG